MGMRDEDLAAISDDELPGLFASVGTRINRQSQMFIIIQREFYRYHKNIFRAVVKHR